MPVGIYKTGRKNGWYWLGRKHTEESKKKMSEEVMGRIVSEETRIKMSECRKGKPSNHQAEKVSWECQNCKIMKYLLPCRAKQRIYCSHKCLIPWNKGKTGERSHMWQGGKSFEPYSPEFNKQLKEQIRKRDNFTCQECNYTQEQLGYPLIIHHIDYDKKNCDPENLISLCRSCHTKTNFKREDWESHFNKKVVSQLT